MEGHAEPLVPTLGHVHLKVRDVGRSEAFYRDLLGLEVTERVGDRFTFMSFGREHHDLALQQLGEQAPLPGPHFVGLYHFAVDVRDEAGLAAVARRLLDHSEPFSAVDHGISKALYFNDPDGNGVEVYCDTRAERGQWQGQTRPLDVQELLREAS